MSRFEVRAAWVVGVMLPLLEALRRRLDFSDIPSYIDDFIWGGLLLWAAMAVRGRCEYGNALLVAAWATLCGAMYYSFFGQLESQDPLDVSGLPNGCVIGVKGAILALAIICLFLSIRRTRSSEPPN